MKSLILFLLISAVVGAGVGYAVFSDPELPSVKLFEDTMKAFAKKSGYLEKQFLEKGSLSAQESQLSVHFSAAKDGEKDIKLTMKISPKLVILRFPDFQLENASNNEQNEKLAQQDTEKTISLSGQSILLEPYIKDEQVRWKCIEGSVLVRLRSKDCRLGYGVLTTELR
jgi:hypothetical protein